MKTIYLLQTISRYSVPPKILRAYEERATPDDLIALMTKAGIEDRLEIVEIEMQPDKSSPSPFLSGMLAMSTLLGDNSGDEDEYEDDGEPQGAEEPKEPEAAGS